MLFQFRFSKEFARLPCGHVPEGHEGTRVRRITVSTMAFVQSAVRDK